MIYTIYYIVYTTHYILHTTYFILYNICTTLGNAHTPSSLNENPITLFQPPSIVSSMCIVCIYTHIFNTIKTLNFLPELSPSNKSQLAIYYLDEWAYSCIVSSYAMLCKSCTMRCCSIYHDIVHHSIA